PAFLLYVDQGEELYVRADEHQRRRFSEVISGAVVDSRLYMLMSMRTDFLGELQKDESPSKVHRKIDVPPLREAELRKVVSCPAELLSARFETAELMDIITRRTAEDSGRRCLATAVLYARRYVDADGKARRRSAPSSRSIVRAWRRTK